MPFELFAQQNQADQDFKNGVLIGTAIAMVISAGIPIVTGLIKGRAFIGIIGGLISGISALFLGCLLGLPMACVFVIIIMAMGDGDTEPRRKRKKRRRPISDVYDDEDDEPRRRRYDDDFGRGPR